MVVAGFPVTNEVAFHIVGFDACREKQIDGLVLDSDIPYFAGHSEVLTQISGTIIYIYAVGRCHNNFVAGQFKTVDPFRDFDG